MKHTLIFVVFAVLFNVLFALPLKTNPEEIGGNFEGDMILNKEQMNALRHPDKRNGQINERYRWPNKTLFYELSSDFNDDQKDQIKKALSELAKHTCIKFKPRTPNTLDYVNVTNDEGCNSRIGHQGGQQNMSLNVGGCLKLGKIMHEFIHALGFYHMQSAADRDNYVSIIKDNIKDGYGINFEKYDDTVVTNFGIPYDYGSIMHYPADAFSKNGKPTIVPLDNTVTIGNRDRLSASDIRKLNIMYDCECETK